MLLLHRLRSAFRNFTTKHRMEKQLSEEMSSYVELLIQRNLNEGMNYEDARRAALVKVGGVEQVKEEVRESRAGFAFETLLIDLRYGARSLLKHPGFTLTAGGGVSPRLGANTPVFRVSHRPFFC